MNSPQPDMVEFRFLVPRALDDEIRQAAEQNERTKAQEARMLLRLGLKYRSERDS